jgi:hypothetical protein
MKVKSVRIPEEIDRAIDYVARSEKLEKNSFLRKLTRLGSLPSGKPPTC